MNGIAAAALGYLLGSIPTSIVAGRLLGRIDIREHGSGNAGATNVLRVLGWRPAVAVLIVDLAKGWAAVRLAPTVSPAESPEVVAWIAVGAALAAVLGHVWPVWVRFRGGKGVAAGAGAMLALAPPVGLSVVAVFAAVVGTTRRVAAGSVAAAIALPLLVTVLARAGWIESGRPLLAFAIVLALLLTWAHRANLRRIVRGEEPAAF